MSEETNYEKLARVIVGSMHRRGYVTRGELNKTLRDYVVRKEYEKEVLEAGFAFPSPMDISKLVNGVKAIDDKLKESKLYAERAEKASEEIERLRDEIEEMTKKPNLYQRIKQFFMGK